VATTSEKYWHKRRQLRLRDDDCSADCNRYAGPWVLLAVTCSLFGVVLGIARLHFRKTLAIAVAIVSASSLWTEGPRRALLPAGAPAINVFLIAVAEQTTRVAISNWVVVNIIIEIIASSEANGVLAQEPAKVLVIVARTVIAKPSFRVEVSGGWPRLLISLASPTQRVPRPCVCRGGWRWCRHDTSWLVPENIPPTKRDVFRDSQLPIGFRCFTACKSA